VRILLINQFVPPDEAPTARLLGDLKEHLETLDCSVTLLGASAGYQGGAKTGLARLVRDAKAHFNLLWKGLRLGPFDWIVCLTDPPGLPFTSAILARVKRARLAHWAMDVYPQVAVKLGALPDGLPSRLVAAAMRFGYRSSHPLVALDEDMKQVLETCGGTRIQVQPPWPPLPTAQGEPFKAPEKNRPSLSDTQALNVQRSSPISDGAAASSPLSTLHSPLPTSQSSPPISTGASTSRRTWLYSGNLGRAHEYKDLLEAQRLLEASGAPWQLVFQGSGPCRNEAQALASQLGLKNCLWQPYAPSDQLLPSLLAADVLIASQKESLQGLLWPSKLALMTLTAQPILWVGPTQGQIATDLAAASPLNGLFSPGHPESIAHWLASLPPKDSANLPTQESIQSRAKHLRIQGLNLWASQLLHSQK
jgi:glycosyltransferase involved in cell wall biosynthesis